MAKDRRKVSHIHSKIQDRQPTPASLEYGELGVNYNADHEFISMKNSNDNVVRFSSDGQIVDIMEKKEVIPYSGTVDNIHLDTNRSNIEIKLNQVVAENTVFHDKVNGAKDIDNQYVNPTEDQGLTNGAGFAIDMSLYAMQGANPTFSGITDTCYTNLNGVTTISGSSCGDKLSIVTSEVNANNKTWKETISAKTESISGKTTTIGNNGEVLNVSGTTTETRKGDVIETNLANKTENVSGNSIVNVKGNYSGTITGTTTEIKVGNVAEYHSGTTTETKAQAVIENNLAAKTESTTGINTIDNKNNYIVNTSGDTHITTDGNTSIHSDEKLGISAKGELSLVSSEEDIIITANDDICETAGGDAAFYGVNSSSIGLNCEGDARSTTTYVAGNTVNISAGTANTNANNVNITAPTTTISGTNLNIIENNTVLKSCGKFELQSDSIEFKQCDGGTGGEVVFEYCDGYTVKSDAIVLSGCTNNGSILIKEKDATISGTTLKIDELNSISAITNTAYVSGTTLNVKENTVNVTANTNVSGGTFNSTTSGNTTISSNGNICATSDKDVNVGGYLNTRIGYNCSGNKYSNNVLVYGQSEVEVNSQVICLDADNDAYVGGSNSTNIGVDCNLNLSDTTVIASDNSTTVKGPTVEISAFTTNISGNTVNITGTTKISGNTTIGGNTVINNNLNVSGNTTLKNTYLSGNTYFKPACTSITSNTVEEAVCEVLEAAAHSAITTSTVSVTATSRSNDNVSNQFQKYTLRQDNSDVAVSIEVPNVKLSASTTSTTSPTYQSYDMIYSGTTRGTINIPNVTVSALTPGTGILTSYGIYYNGEQRGVIDIPKDLVVTSGSLVRGTWVDANTFVENPSGNDTAIKLVIANQDTPIYINTKDLVTDLVLTSSTGNISAVSGYSDGHQTYDINVTTGRSLSVTHNGHTDTYDPAISQSAFTLTHSALTIDYGVVVTGMSDDSYDTSAAKTVSIPTAVSHIDRGSFTVTHCGSSTTFDPATTTSATLSHGTLTIQKNGTTLDTFDVCNSKTIDIPIPTSVCDLSRGKFTVAHCGNSTTFDPCSDTSVTLSHGSFTVSHNGSSTTFDVCNTTSATLSHEALSLTYGQTCNSSGTITYNTQSATSVTIPATISDVTCGDIVDNSAGTTGASASCVEIKKPLCVTGVISAYGAIYSSDASLKENVGFIERDKINRINHLPFKTFNFKDDESKRLTYGVIAQEVQRVGLDELVHTKEDGTLGVDYISLLILKNEALNREIGELTRRINKLEEKLNQTSDKL